MENTVQNDCRAVFLDRDGTIIKDKGFLADKRDVEFYSFTLRALKLLQQRFKLFIVTNQSGVAKGIINIEDVETVNSYITARLSENDIRIDDVYYCPHKNEDLCNCKKPGIYFFELAVKNHGVIAEASFVIGDHPSDILFARNAGATGIFLLTGHGRSHLKEIIRHKEAGSKIIICRDLYSASLKILKSL